METNHFKTEIKKQEEKFPIQFNWFCLNPPKAFSHNLALVAKTPLLYLKRICDQNFALGKRKRPKLRKKKSMF